MSKRAANQQQAATDQWANDNPQDHPVSLEAIRRELRQIDEDLEESRAITTLWQGVALVMLAMFLAVLWSVTMRGGA